MTNDGGYDPDPDYGTDYGTDYGGDTYQGDQGDYSYDGDSDWTDWNTGQAQAPAQTGPTADTGADPAQYAGQYADVGQTSTWDPQSGVPLGAPPQATGATARTGATGASGPPSGPHVGESYAEANLELKQWQSRAFERCLFTEAQMGGWSTTSCSFLQCDFTGADMHEGVHRGSVFISCTFREVDLTSARFEDCRFTGSVFDSVQFGGVVFHGGDLSEVALGGASLSGLNLSRIRFYGADLSGADFSGADLTGADLRNVTVNGTSFEEADLQGALLENFDIRSVRLAGARIDYDQAAQLVAALGVVVG